MEIKLNIGYPELLEIIKQLPTRQIQQLIVDLNEYIAHHERKREVPDLTELLLKGPVMDEKQYEAFIKSTTFFRRRLPKSHIK